MLVRARDDIYTMAELQGKKIGLTKSLNTIKNDWWRDPGARRASS